MPAGREGPARESDGGLTGWLGRLSQTRPSERPAVWAAFFAFFGLLGAYYVLRPIRDEMALQLGPAGLQGLFDAVFLTMLATVPAFGWLVRRFPRRRVLPWVYGFFVVNLVAFFPFLSAHGPQTPVLARVFYVWVSVFAATGVSVFWSLLADLFTESEARRVYGFIAAGGTAGALVGPSLTAGLVAVVGIRALVLVAAGLLTGTIVALVRLRTAGAALEAERPRPAAREDVSPSLWSGITGVLRSRLLLGICGFVLLFTLLSTFLYVRTAEILPRVVPSSAARTALLAKTDGAVNLLSLLLQVFVFSPFLGRLGLRVTLALMPAVSLVGFAVLGRWPGLWPLVAFGVARRAGEFAFSKPAREILFNNLTPDEKYKAKNVIDTVIYRSGDEVFSRTFSALRAVGLSAAQLTWGAVALSGAWSCLGWWLGGHQEGPRPGGSGPPGVSDERPPRRAAES